jgi:hypothetical protein
MSGVLTESQNLTVGVVGKCKKQHCALRMKRAPLPPSALVFHRTTCAHTPSLAFHPHLTFSSALHSSASSASAFAPTPTPPPLHLHLHHLLHSCTSSILLSGLHRGRAAAAHPLLEECQGATTAIHTQSTHHIQVHILSYIHYRSFTLHTIHYTLYTILYILIRYTLIHYTLNTPSTEAPERPYCQNASRWDYSFCSQACQKNTLPSSAVGGRPTRHWSSYQVRNTVF